MEKNFELELRQLLNEHSKENGSNTPDYILAQYLINCLDNFNNIIRQRENWYGREHVEYPNGYFHSAEIVHKKS
jgi:hypothetical protein